MTDPNLYNTGGSPEYPPVPQQPAWQQQPPTQQPPTQVSGEHVSPGSPYLQGASPQLPTSVPGMNPPGQFEPMGPGGQPSEMPPNQPYPQQGYVAPMYPGPMIPARRPPLGLPPNLWGQAALSAVIGYGVTLVLAIIVTVGIMLAFSGTTDDSLGRGSSEIDGGWLLSLPIHLIAMALFGTMNLELDGGMASAIFGGGEFGISLFLPILLLTGAMVTSIVLWTKRTAKRYPVTLPGTLALSAVTAGTLAVMTVLLAAVFPLKVGSGGIEISFGSAGVAAFFGAFFIAFAATWITWILKSGIWAGWARRYRFFSHGALRVASTHVATLIAVCSIVAVLIAGIEGDGASGFALGFAGMINLGGYLAIVGSFGSLTAHAGGLVDLFGQTGSNLSGDTSTTVGLYSEGTEGYLFIGLILAIIAVVGAAFLLAARRVYSRPGPISWLVTIGSYAVIGLVLQLVYSVTFDVSSDLTEWGRSSFELGGAIAPAAWTFLVFGIWGALVEVMARFVFPRMIYRMSPKTLQRLHKFSGIDQPIAQAYGQPMPGMQPGYGPQQGFGPQPGVPQQGFVAQPGMPQPGVPQQGFVAQPGMPQPGVQPGMPQQSYVAQPGMPQQGFVAPTEMPPQGVQPGVQAEPAQPEPAQPDGYGPPQGSVSPDGYGSQFGYGQPPAQFSTPSPMAPPSAPATGYNVEQYQPVQPEAPAQPEPQAQPQAPAQAQPPAQPEPQVQPQPPAQPELPPSIQPGQQPPPE